jgi:four helix bundle protein
MPMAVQTYRDLLVWQKAMDLVVEVYQLTKSFPADERFGLTTQIQRAVVSIPANIAEGYGRLHRRDYVRHLSFARGSLVEAETHLQIAVRLNYVARDEGTKVWHQFQEIGRLLSGLIRSLNGSADQALSDP